MPSRSPSFSPKRVKSKKLKHKTRSRSPYERRRSRSPSDDYPQHSRHKSSRHKHKNRARSESYSDSEYETVRESKEHKRGRGSYSSRERERIREDDRAERRLNDAKRRQSKREKGVNPFKSRSDEGGTYGRQDPEQPAAEVKKEEPNFEVSGKLAEETNTYKGIVIKYNEPPEARKPKRRWRLYPFKGDEMLKIMHIHRQSAYLLGRDRRIADIPIDHPSCSKQHAVLQFRLVPYTRENGTEGRRIRPYIIDLGAANGTYVNNQRIEAQRYVELMEKDVLKFGFSTREYVILTDKADTSALQDELEDENVVE